jgi:hypothetical protein
MPIPSGAGQVNVIHTGAGVPHGAQWTLGLNVATYGSDVVTAAKDFEVALLNSGIYTLVSSNVVVTTVGMKFGPDATGPSTLEPANQPGTATATDTPQVAVLVRKNTALGGRAGRGRLYLPGVADQQITPGGILSGGFITDLQETFDAFFDELGNTNLFPLLLHQAGSPLSTPTPITGFSVQSVIATQRRRVRP